MDDSDKTITQDLSALIGESQLPPSSLASSGTRLDIKPDIVRPGTAQRFSNETERILRFRLNVAAINLSIVLGIGFVGNLAAGTNQWLLFRAVILAGTLVCMVVLYRFDSLRIRWLRGIELFLFGGVAVQMCLMMYSRMDVYLGRNDPVSLVGVQNFFHTAFCLHILTYGIFMPNNWRRAALITVLLACMPYAVQYLHQYLHPSVTELSRKNLAASPIPVTFIAALIASFGSHIINRTRREAFQAKQIMQYRLQEKIGSGGMGDVYRAEHVLMKRRCAMKVIRPDRLLTEDAQAKFEREVIATARLSHWNTIEIYDYGHSDDGSFFYVMELLDGESLQSLVSKYGPIDPSRVAYLLAQVADALFESHQAGLIHRDIKPANIFAAKRGGVYDVVKLLDFGLVREINDEAPNDENRSKISGTPHYMAPEQATHFHLVDGRADIYAIGAVAYFLLTGKPPFSAKTTIEILMAHASRPIPKLSDMRPETPADLGAVIERCLAKEPCDRYQTARELATAFRNCGCYHEWNSQAAEDWWRKTSGAISETLHAK